MDVYNGKFKVICEDKMFMTQSDVKECVLSIKIKNCESFDRIPQRIIVDGIDYLILPLTHLFKIITFPISPIGIGTNVFNVFPLYVLLICG